MGEITVQEATLRAGAQTLGDAAARVEQAVCDGAVPAMAEAEHGLAGSVTSATLGDLSRQMVEVGADLVTAMRGVSQGLERVAERFCEVDRTLGAAAGGTGPRRSTR